MMKYVVNQSVKNFSSAFGTEQTYGEVVFLEENDLQYLSSNEIIINSRRILLETSKK